MNESLVKADQIGRLRYTSEQKQTMVDTYRASGLSAPRFAAHHGVNYQTLAYASMTIGPRDCLAQLAGSSATGKGQMLS